MSNIEINNIDDYMTFHGHTTMEGMPIDENFVDYMVELYRLANEDYKTSKPNNYSLNILKGNAKEFFKSLGITGGLIITCMAIITGSLAFWFGKSDTIANTTESIITLTSTYPEDIFNGFIKLVLYTIVPVGLVAYIPVNILLNISLVPILIILGFTLMFIAIANIFFYSGLKRYTSTNLMNARV